ncbi:MAG: hypothetical protein CfClM3_0273 [Methanobrevibacter sp. CfCl-M3]
MCLLCCSCVNATTWFLTGENTANYSAGLTHEQDHLIFEKGDKIICKMSGGNRCDLSVENALFGASRSNSSFIFGDSPLMAAHGSYDDNDTKNWCKSYEAIEKGSAIIDLFDLTKHLIDAKMNVTVI